MPDGGQPKRGLGGIEAGASLVDVSKITHLTVSMLLGGGTVGDWSSTWIRDDTFLFMEPNIDIELNVSRSFQLGFGVGYRIVDDLEHPYVSESDLNGITFGLTFKIGSF